MPAYNLNLKSFAFHWILCSADLKQTNSDARWIRLINSLCNTQHMQTTFLVNKKAVFSFFSGFLFCCPTLQPFGKQFATGI